MGKAKIEYPKSEKEFYREYLRKYFPTSGFINGDELVVVLRAHLLVEVLIEMLLKKNMNSDKILHERDFSSYLKIIMVQSMGLARIKIIEALQQLNTIRNNFAHNIKTELEDQSIDKIVKFIPDENMREKCKYAKKLSFGLGISYLLGAFVNDVFDS